MQSWRATWSGKTLLLATTLLQPLRVFGQGPLAVPHPVTALPASPASTATATHLLGDTLFRKKQMANARVFGAAIDSKFTLKDLFRLRGLPYPGNGIYLRAFKREHQLEVWVQPVANAKYVLLKTYSICTISGRMGPKRAEGDEQTPEGFYIIDDFNPRSGYHLSLHLNYPNAADRLRDAKHAALGGSIYIHGGCKTIGCLPITDQAIKEVYWLALESRASSQLIPVHIFPTRLTEESMGQLNKAFKGDVQLMSFWGDLKRGYDYFEEKRELPPYYVDPVGRYRIGVEVPAVGLLPKNTPAQEQQQPKTSSPRKNSTISTGPKILGQEIAPASPATAAKPESNSGSAPVPQIERPKSQ
jgi:murein L,D-transpeptidase YafK